MLKRLRTLCLRGFLLDRSNISPGSLLQSLENLVLEDISLVWRGNLSDILSNDDYEKHAEGLSACVAHLHGQAWQDSATKWSRSRRACKLRFDGLCQTSITTRISAARTVCTWWLASGKVILQLQHRHKRLATNTNACYIYCIMCQLRNRVPSYSSPSVYPWTTRLTSRIQSRSTTTMKWLSKVHVFPLTRLSSKYRRTFTPNFLS
jgi:hypothetical protein